MRKIAKHGVMSVDARHPAQNGKKFDNIKIAWLLLCLLFSGHAHAADLKARLWPTATNTRLVIETPALAEFKIIDSLTNPPRLVLDVVNGAALPEVINNADLRDADYLRQFHVGRYDQKTLRFVFTLGEEVKYTISRIQPVGNYAHRLVLDLVPKQLPDPLGELISSLQLDTTRVCYVVIDPGHGGEDPGAVSPNQNYEKNVVLAISHSLKKEIDNRPNMRAFLTRKSDVFVPLSERVKIAHRLNADAFLSIHADSVKSRRARGSSVYVLSQKGASSKLAQRLAKHANESDMIGGLNTEVQFIMPFYKDGSDTASRRLATAVRKEIAKINKLHKNNTEFAGFAVLKSPVVPSILVETAFISNPHEEEKLHDKNFQQKMAAAIATGVEIYMRQDPCEKNGKQTY